MSLKLQQALFDVYGNSDKRIKHVKSMKWFWIGEQGPTDRPNMAHCSVSVSVGDNDEISVIINGCTPVNTAIKKLVESKGGTAEELQYQGHIAAKCRADDSDFIRELAEKILSVVAPGAPRYDTPAFKYRCPEIARSLNRLADVLDKHEVG